MTITTERKPSSPKNNNSTTNNNNNSEDEKQEPFLLYSPIMYYACSLLHVLFYLSVYIKNPYYLILFVYAIVPYLDHFFSMDNLNPTKKDEKALKQLLSFKIPLYLSIVLDWVTFIYGINHVFNNSNGIIYNIGILFILSSLQALSINLSHEVIHKPRLIDNALGVISLTKNLYLHWFIEHNYGHHKWVATPLDPASAIKGQVVYDFIPKSLYGGYKSAWNIEIERLKDNNYPFYYNKMYYAYLLMGLFPLGICYLFNLRVMILAIFTGYMGNLFLEVINYIEHYGLRRKEESPGVYEVVNIFHSWNAPHRITNYLLFKLQRHSDHHANALKPYQILSSYKESPMLPQGYDLCIMIALFPSIWFDIMNPIVDAYNKDKNVSEKLFKEAEKKCIQFLHKAAVFFSSLVLLQIAANNFM